MTQALAFPTISAVGNIDAYIQAAKQFPILTEEEGAHDHPAVAKFVRKLARGFTEPTALCGHRPVLPAIFTAFGLDPRPMVVSEVIVLHRDKDGNNVRVEVHKPTA